MLFPTGLKIASSHLKGRVATSRHLVGQRQAIMGSNKGTVEWKQDGIPFSLRKILPAPCWLHVTGVQERPCWGAESGERRKEAVIPGCLSAGTVCRHIPHILPTSLEQACFAPIVLGRNKIWELVKFLTYFTKLFIAKDRSVIHQVTKCRFFLCIFHRRAREPLRRLWWSLT